MSAPLCTFITPSRKRPARLKESIASIEKTTARENYRIHVRTEMDDLDTRVLAAALLNDGRIDRIVNGPHRGYDYVHLAWSELLPVSTPWLWVWSDDTQLFGDWFTELAKVPTEKAICHAEFVTNNGSTYCRAVAGPFPVVPANVLEITGRVSFGYPIDLMLDLDLRVMRRWETRFLNGVTVKHDRIVDETLDASRY